MLEGEGIWALRCHELQIHFCADTPLEFSASSSSSIGGIAPQVAEAAVEAEAAAEPEVAEAALEAGAAAEPTEEAAPQQGAARDQFGKPRPCPFLDL